MKIHRKDLTAPATVEFSGKFGEKPALYTFRREDPMDPRFTCEVEDEIAVQLLLAIEGYEVILPSEEAEAERQRKLLAREIAEGKTPAPSQFPAAAESQLTTSASPLGDGDAGGFIQQARDYYFEKLNKRASPRWDVKTIFDRIAADALAKAQEESNQAASHVPSLQHLQSETAKHDVKQSSAIAQPPVEGSVGDVDPAASLNAMPIEGVPSEQAMAQGNGGEGATHAALETAKATRKKSD